MYGFQVPLDDPYDSLGKGIWDAKGPFRTVSGDLNHFTVPLTAPCTPVQITTPEFGVRELCFMADTGIEESIDIKQAKHEKEWRKLHDAVTARVDMYNKNTPGGRKVKIAIFNTGIELNDTHPALSDERIKYRDWVDQDSKWKDDAGHGTHLATLLWRMAPNAIIHVARVFRKKPKGGKSVIAIIEVSYETRRAMKHAVDEWKVDIVVMSFGLGKSDQDLNSEIQRTAGNGVLIFAAASNNERNDEIAWPARAENVICVHSRNGIGERSGFTPDPKDHMRTMVLGESVESAWPPHFGLPDDRKRMSGTSCAAPIAASIVAIILDYSMRFLMESEWSNLCRVDSIRRLLEGLSDSSKANGFQTIYSC